MKGKHVLVTVGTTKFEKLINTVSSDEILTALHKQGYTSVCFQTGTGMYKERSFPDIELTYQGYIEEFCEAVRKADLVISHAGAGTCLEVLQNEKKLIVVINEDLMDNHQRELAEELEERGYLYYCTCDTLEELLNNKDLGALEKYRKANTKAFAAYLDYCVGFT